MRKKSGRSLLKNVDVPVVIGSKNVLLGSAGDVCSLWLSFFI